MKTAENQTLYRENEIVPVTGKYKCMVCGNVKLFYKDEKFPICDNCMHGKTDDVWTLSEELEIVEFGSI
jgi:hypothetical protein